MIPLPPTVDSYHKPEEVIPPDGLTDLRDKKFSVCLLPSVTVKYDTSRRKIALRQYGFTPRGQVKSFRLIRFAMD